MKLSRTAYAALLAGAAIVLTGAATAPTTFDDDETALIVSHGPWPVKTDADPSNRVSGKPAAIAYGKTLFESNDLSVDRQRSCATCHQEDLAFADGIMRGIGLTRVDRNTPALFNMRLNRWFGRDGKSDSLWAQSIAPILDARELGMTPTTLKTRLATTQTLSDGYRQIFGAAPAAHEAETVMVNVAKSLAAFQETIVSGKSSFDMFRDGLAAEDPAGITGYPEAARRGLKLFVGKGRCDLCHFGANFTNGEFHDIGLPHFPEPGRVDKGRYGGIQQLRKSRFNLLGPFNDDKLRATAGFTRHVRLTPKNWGEFRVPSLRNAAKTAPYMHDGSKATLEDVVDHYSEIPEDRLHQDGEKLLRPLNLTVAEKADLVAFLKTL
jgi:cytochrome c peroxidase